MGIAINPSTVNPQREIYLEQKLSATGLSETLEFDARFRHYRFEWMTTAPDQFSSLLASELYATYQTELKRVYP